MTDMTNQKAFEVSAIVRDEEQHTAADADAAEEEEGDAQAGGTGAIDNDIITINNKEEQPIVQKVSHQQPQNSITKRRVGLALLLLCVVGAIVAIVVWAVMTRSSSSSSSSSKSTMSLSPSPQNSNTQQPQQPSLLNSTTQQQQPQLSNTSSSTTSTGGTPQDETIVYYHSKGVLFNTSIPLFNPDIVRGYSSTSDMKNDIMNAIKFYLNGLIATNMNVNASISDGSSSSHPPTTASNGGMAGAPPSAPGPAPGPESDVASSGSSSTSTTNSYGTHNQEDGVEEGDMIVSNGEAVFAAYGGYILIWNVTSGNMITQINIPGFNQTYSWDNSTNYWNQPQVQQLLLYENQLLVLVNGFGSTYTAPDGRSSPILYSYKDTQIRLYSIASLPTLELLYTTNINGYVSSTRAINGKVHIVTSSGIDTWTDFEAPFQIQNYNNTSDEEYAAAVRKQAELEAIPRFVNELMDELTIDSIVPNMFRISLFQAQLASDIMEQSIFSNGLVNSITLIHSLDMTATDSSSIKLSISGAFLPSWSADVYSSTDMLIVSGQQWEYNETTNSSSSSTYLLSFQLNDASTTPFSTGTIPGYVLNARSVDVVGSVLRVATSVRTTWGGWPMYWERRRLLADDIMIWRPLNQTTQNFIILLNLSQPNSTMAELSRLQLGKPDETFTAVRFFDNIAYAVTFEQKDPLYVLDLTNSSKPSIKAELELSGFSDNLDPINSDNTLILAIGQETDANGTILGMQISVFDFRDLTNVKLAQRYVVEKNMSAWSSSDAQWDYQAIRYTDGRLIIPLDIYNWQSPSDEFHGFVIFSADANQITEDCRISTPQSQSYVYVDSNSTETTNTTTEVCYYCGWLPRRSFVFNGKVMTTDNRLVKSTDMNTCKEEWSTNIAINDTNNLCCW